VDGTGPESYSKVDVGISDFEPSGSTTIQLLC
jgi:hypothetical protein